MLNLEEILSKNFECICKVDTRSKYKSLGYKLVYSVEPILCTVKYNGVQKDFIIDCHYETESVHLDIGNEIPMTTLVNYGYIYEDFDKDVEKYIELNNSHNSTIKDITLRNVFNNAELIYKGLTELFG